MNEAYQKILLNNRVKKVRRWAQGKDVIWWKPDKPQVQISDALLREYIQVIAEVLYEANKKRRHL